MQYAFLIMEWNGLHVLSGFCLLRRLRSQKIDLNSVTILNLTFSLTEWMDVWISVQVRIELLYRSIDLLQY